MVRTGNTVGRFVSAVLLALLLALSVARPAGAASFIRGDNDVSGALEITDAVRVFGFLFLGNPVEFPCRDAADSDDSGVLDLTDGIYVLNFLFTGGAPPPSPYPGCGEDLTADNVDCAVFSRCDLDLPPRAAFTAEPGFGEAPLEVFFDAAESSAPDGEIAGYSWSFGDGGLAKDRAPSHVFETPGQYTVILTVTDDGGSRDQASSTVVIHACRPQAPWVEPLDELTTEDSVIVRGTAPGASVVRVLGATGAQTTTPGDDGAFEVVVPLARDSANRISVSAQSDCELASSPVVVCVTHDSTPPDLHIDLPADGAALAVDAVDVIGRVGDLLSGFRGLAVTVNGRDAVVDVGIGNNGTYLARDVPLQAEGSTAITVEASDFLGNSASRTISVRRQAPAKDAPRIELVSGNGQTAAMKSLVPQPVVVRVLDRGGVPFAGKLVLFRVSRSDGLLGEDEVEGERQSMQARTDGDGLARVHWRLGTDAGCGNNRLEASSVGVSGTVFVCASATPGPAVQINIGSGNGQYAESGALAPEPLRVRVSDGCNGAEGVLVTFTVVRGGGSLDGETSVVVPTSRTGHASTPFVLGPGGGNHEVVATFPGNIAAPARFAVFGTVREADESTSLEGLVLDNGSYPLEGARCTLLLEGADLLVTSTVASGRFRFDDIPGEGPARAYVYGLTVTRIGAVEPVEVPQGSFPTLSYEVYLVPEARNEMPTTVILPRLREANARLYDGTEDVELTVEGVEGLRMLVKAGSVRRPDGSLPTPAEPVTLALNQVHHDDVPMPMPDGAAPPFAWTLQPSGLSFDPPVEVTYPNLSTLAPGSVAWFLSFNHSTERFEIVSTGHVTADGASILTDPGSGLTLSGWGCNCPPYSVCADVVGCPLTISGEKLVGGAVENGSYLCFNQGESIRFTAQYDEDCGSGDVEWTIEPAAAGSFRDGQNRGDEVVFVQEDDYLSQEADDVVVTCTRGGYTAEFRMTVFKVESSSGILSTGETREFRSDFVPVGANPGRIAGDMNNLIRLAGFRTRTYSDEVTTDEAVLRQDEVTGVVEQVEFFGVVDVDIEAPGDVRIDELWVRVSAGDSGGDVFVTFESDGNLSHREHMTVIDIEITEVWSDQFDGIDLRRVNGLPGYGGSYNANNESTYPYFVMGPAREDELLGLLGVTRVKAKVRIGDVSDAGLEKLQILLADAGEGSPRASLTPVGESEVSVQGDEWTVTLRHEHSPADADFLHYKVVAVLDLDGDGEPEPREIASVFGAAANKNYHVKVGTWRAYNFSDVLFDVFENVRGLVDGREECISCEHLSAFLDSSHVPLADSGTAEFTETVEPNRLEHNVGVLWDDSGTAPIKKYVYPAGGFVARSVLDSESFLDLLRGTLDLRTGEVHTHFDESPSSPRTFEWRMDSGVFFSSERFNGFFGNVVNPFLTPSEQNELDLYLAFGAAGLHLDLRVTVAPAGKDGGFVVQTIEIAGYMNDTYDWNWPAGGTDQLLLGVQAGFGSLGDAGRVFRNEVRLEAMLRNSELAGEGDRTFDYSFETPD